MLARQEIRKEIAIFSIQPTHPPVAGYRLDNTVSISWIRINWNKIGEGLNRHKMKKRQLAICMCF